MSKVKEFDKLVHESTSALAKLLVQDHPHDSSLISASAKEKKVQKELEAHIKSMEKKMEVGLHTCINALDHCRNLPQTKKEVIEELYKCLSAISNLETLAHMGQALFSEASWKSQLGISSNCMESLYQGAKFLFNDKHFNEAEKSFFVLCALDSTVYAYWIGLGHSSFHLHHYKQAIDAYSMASALNPEDVWPHIWAANSFEKEKDLEYAKMALQEALALEKAKPKPDSQLINSLERRLKNK